jgi:hypothetical protein
MPYKNNKQSGYGWTSTDPSMTWSSRSGSDGTSIELVRGALKASIKLSRRPRLADWGEYAAAVYEVMGWGAEQFLSDWNEIVKV